jgi:hypothetical protein
VNLYKIAMPVAVGITLASCGTQGGQVVTPTPGFSQSTAPVRDETMKASVAEINHWVPRYVWMAPRSVNYAALTGGASVTIPYYTGSVKSPLDGNTYTYSIAGADPRKSNTTTQISVVPIVARIKFPDGTVLDPTLPGCGDTVSVENRFFDGPNFKSTPLTSNGVNVGKVQVTDAFQRAEFWTLLKAQSQYHTVLTASQLPIVVNVKAPSGSSTVAGVCSGSHHRVGEIDINAYDALVTQLAVKYSTPSQVPTVLSYNVALTLYGQCCVTGYHSAFGRGSGTQVYAVGGYFDYGVFQNGKPADIETWTHELGELLNDPFVNNTSPAWGHVGQVTGCKNYFEVGDPLTGTPFNLKYNGFTYHPQELAFFSWFFRTPSTGTGGKFSFKGTFTRAQGRCQ